MTNANNSRATGDATKLATVVVLSLVAAWLFHRHFAAPDFIAHKKAFTSLGEYAAEEFAKLVPGGSVQVVYDVPDRAASEVAGAANRIALKRVQALAFKKRLATLGKYTFSSDLKLPRSALAMNSEWPGTSFQKLLGDSAIALVLFSSLPSLDPASASLILHRPGKIVVVGMTLPEIMPSVQSRLVHLAVSNRVPAPPPPVGEETTQAWARRVYAVVTPETAKSPRRRRYRARCQ